MSKQTIQETIIIFMKIFQLIILFIICSILFSCGKGGPLALPEDKVDKSEISFDITSYISFKLR